MGYDLHLTRAEYWIDSDQSPISLSEWIAFARDDPALLEEGSIDEGQGPVPLFECVRADGTELSLAFRDGQITVSGAFNGVDDLLALARRLGAHLVGDDHERYPA